MHRLLLCAAWGLALAGVEPGDPGVVPEPGRYLADWPAMARWAEAGVTGGVPVVGTPRITVTPGEDLASALAAGGVIRLAAGEHRLAAAVVLPSGTDLWGEGAATTTLVLSGEAGLILRDAKRSGIRGLRVIHAAAAAELAARPIVDRILANRTATGVPGAHTAITITRSRDCWIEDCVLEALPDAPFTVQDSSHLTIRRVRIEGVVQRGSGHGIIRLDGLRDSLLHRLDVDGVRLIRIMGSSAGNVLGGSAFAVPIAFQDSAEVSDNLFEANVHAIPPGNPYPAFTYGVAAVGLGNTVVDSRSYAGGTDAVSKGVQLGPNAAYILQQAPQQGTWDSENGEWIGTRWFAKAMRSATGTSAVTVAAAVPTISPPADLVAGAGPEIALGLGPVVGFSAAVGPLLEPWDAVPKGLPKAGAAVGDAAPVAIAADALRDGYLNALAIAGGDRRRLVLGAVLVVGSDTKAWPVMGGPGEVAWYCSGHRLVAGETIALAAGKHPLWGVVRVLKPNPFTKRIDVRLTFSAAAQSLAERAPPPPVPIPDPAGGTLYATTAVLDRQEMLAWAQVSAVHRLLAQAEPHGLDQALQELATAQRGRIGGRLALRWQSIVRRIEAAHAGETNEMVRWRLRSSNYYTSGLQQRAWAFEPFINKRWPGAPEMEPERIIP